MKYLRNFFTLFFLLSFILMISCNPDFDASLELQIQNSISKEEAIIIARDFISSESKRTKNARSNGVVALSDLKVKEVKGANNKIVLYVVNNTNGGWQLVAGAKVENPILAFGDDGYFDPEQKKMNAGLGMWMTNTIGQMELAFNDPDQYFNTIKGSESADYIVPPEDPTCVETYSEVQPLMVDGSGNEVQFGQAFPENYYYMSCTWDPLYQGRAAAGCVPLAMAQVMWYYKSPTSYNWSIIPRAPISSGSSSAQMETGRLVHDIKNELAPWIWVTCPFGTGAFTSTFDNLDKAYDAFGYDAYQFSSSGTLQNEISAGRPVIAVGGNSLENERHCWVIDGRKNFIVCPSGNGYMYLHCNWGWHGFSNGWFGIGGYNPGGNNYNSNLHYFKIVKR